MWQPCSEFNFTRKIKLFFYEVNKHFTIEEFNIHIDDNSHNALGLSPIIIPFTNINNELFEIVRDHTSADFIVFPFQLSSLIYQSGIFGDAKIFRYKNNPTGNSKVLAFMTSLPYFYKYETKHLFFSGHDWEGPYDVNCTVINQSVSKLNNNHNMICMPHFVDDINYRPQDERILYCTNFFGYIYSHEIREELVKSLIYYHNGGGCLPLNINTTSVFFGHLPEKEKVSLRIPFLDSIYRSITSLCPRGTGLNSIRFYETMCMGRIPILISDNCRLPLEDSINWESCILRIDESDIPNVGGIIENFMSRIDDRTLMRMFLQNRMTWEKFFNPLHAQFLYYMELSKILSSS